MPEKIVSITLCRKNSRRFYDKVRYPFLGIPLYLHTVCFAQALRYPYYFAHDYEKIYLPDGIIEVHRDDRYSGDKHFTCEEIRGFKIDADIYIFLQVTSPLRNLNTIIHAIECFKNNKNYLCGVMVKRIENKFVYDEIKNNVNFCQGNRTDNGCEIKPIYIETGAFYIFRKEQLEKKHILDCSPEQKMIIGNDDYNIDINTIDDIRRFERGFAE